MSGNPTLTRCYSCRARAALRSPENPEATRPKTGAELSVEMHRRKHPTPEPDCDWCDRFDPEATPTEDRHG